MSLTSILFFDKRKKDQEDFLTEQDRVRTVKCGPGDSRTIDVADALAKVQKLATSHRYAIAFLDAYVGQEYVPEALHVARWLREHDLVIPPNFVEGGTYFLVPSLELHPAIAEAVQSGLVNGVVVKNKHASSRVEEIISGYEHYPLP